MSGLSLALAPALCDTMQQELPGLAAQGTGLMAGAVAVPYSHARGDCWVSVQRGYVQLCFGAGVQKERQETQVVCY